MTPWDLVLVVGIAGVVSAVVAMVVTVGCVRIFTRDLKSAVKGLREQQRHQQTLFQSEAAAGKRLERAVANILVSMTRSSMSEAAARKPKD